MHGAIFVKLIRLKNKLAKKKLFENRICIRGAFKERIISEITASEMRVDDSISKINIDSNMIMCILSLLCIFLSLMQCEFVVLPKWFNQRVLCLYSTLVNIFCFFFHCTEEHHMHKSFDQ